MLNRNERNIYLKFEGEKKQKNEEAFSVKLK